MPPRTWRHRRGAPPRARHRASLHRGRTAVRSSRRRTLCCIAAATAAHQRPLTPTSQEVCAPGSFAGSVSSCEIDVLINKSTTSSRLLVRPPPNPPLFFLRAVRAHSFLLRISPVPLGPLPSPARVLRALTTRFAARAADARQRAHRPTRSAVRTVLRRVADHREGTQRARGADEVRCARPVVAAAARYLRAGRLRPVAHGWRGRPARERSPNVLA